MERCVERNCFPWMRYYNYSEIKNRYSYRKRQNVKTAFLTYPFITNSQLAIYMLS